MGSVLEIRPFGGLVTSVADGLVAPRFARRMVNCRIEDGSVRSRRGWRNVSAAGGSFAGLKGIDYVAGYAGIGDSRETYLAFEDRGGTVKPYEANVASLARSEVTDDGTPLSLGDGEFASVGFNGEALALKRGDRVWRHSLGELTDWRELDAARPNDLTAPVAVAFETTEAVGSATPGSAAGWTGATGANIGTVAGSGVTVTHDSVVTDEWKLNITCGNGIPMTMKLQLVADQDWSGAGKLNFEFRWPKAYSKFDNSVTLVLTNSVGTTVTMVCSHTLALVGGTYVLAVEATFPTGYTPADWLVTRYLTIGLTGGASGSAHIYTLSAVTPSGTSSSGGEPTLGMDAVTYKVRFGLASYDGERDVESETVDWSGWFRINPAQRYFHETDNDFFGNVPVVTVQHSGEAQVTACRVYVQFEDDMLARLAGTVALATATLTIDLPYGTLINLPVRIAHEPTLVGAAYCLATYKGFVVYGYDQGGKNVRMSAVGAPGRLARGTDSAEDLEAGADQSLADTFDDAPRWIGGAGDALVVLGKNAAYASLGTLPVAMSPLREIPKSKGVVGPRAACRWTDDSGMPAVVWVGADFEVWMLQIVRGVREDYGEPLAELTLDVRGQVREFLLQTETPVAAQVTVFVDPRDDALWVAYGPRAMVLRKPSVVEGKRPWELYEYAGGSWLLWSGGPRGVRAVRSTGAYDEFERNWSTGAEIVGTNRDGGSAMPTAEWETGELLGPRRRWFGATVFRLGNAGVTVTVTSSEKTATAYVVADSVEHVRFHRLQAGRSHKLTLELDENSAPVQAVAVEEWKRGKRRLA